MSVPEFLLLSDEQLAALQDGDGRGAAAGALADRPSQDDEAKVTPFLAKILQFYSFKARSRFSCLKKVSYLEFLTHFVNKL